MVSLPLHFIVRTKIFNLSGSEMMYNKKHIFFTIVITFIIATMFYASFGGSALYSMLSGGGSSEMDAIKTIVDQTYIFDYDAQKAHDDSMRAYVASLGDPYSNYYNKEDYKALTENLTGNYKGIGVEVYVEPEDGLITVISAFDNSPAQKAGVKPKDKIIKVDNTPVNVDNYNQAISMIKGVIKTTYEDKVDLTLLRGEEEVNVVVTREEIVQNTVSNKMYDDIAYIRISSFGDHTAKDFKTQLNEVKRNNPKGLIIDLRDNPGGTLDAVVAVADELLPEGVIVSMVDKQGSKQEYKSDKAFYDVPVCVLINGSSASASEVLSGAIRDFDRGTLIGTKSFGKGIVQSVFNLTKETAVTITTAKYYTPSGECIHDVGIEPDVKVEATTNDAISMIEYEDDVQLHKAIELLSK